MAAKILDINYIAPHPDMGGWKARHKSRLFVEPIAKALRAWIEYASNHQKRFESDIGQDCVLGPAWAQWGLALRTLLNGELGGLDAGTLDHIIYQNLKEQGFDPEMM